MTPTLEDIEDTEYAAGIVYMTTRKHTADNATGRTTSAEISRATEPQIPSLSGHHSSLHLPQSFQGPPIASYNAYQNTVASSGNSHGINEVRNTETPKLAPDKSQANISSS